MTDRTSPSRSAAEQPTKPEQDPSQPERSSYRAICVAIVAGGLAFSVSLNPKADPFGYYPPKGALSDYSADVNSAGRVSPAIRSSSLGQMPSG